ncbi:DUF317 domain-containing protein [Kitasatospora cathayae]|uniref:DUF317 domain-containing protein n=1 Tax=Kitasatospora cathayae TaxID=3004092 RepID=UPI0038602CB6
MASVTRTIDPLALAAGANGDWVISGGTLGPGTKQGWYIEMSPTIPAPLLNAATTALTSRAPVERLSLTLSRISDDWAQVPRVRQDFGRGTSLSSRKVWKAVGGLGDGASSVTGRPLSRSMLTAMAVSTCCRWAFGWSR